MWPDGPLGTTGYLAGISIGMARSIGGGGSASVYPAVWAQPSAPVSSLPGVPGAYRKASAFVIDGHKATVINSALLPEADMAIRREGSDLQALSISSSLHGSLPEVQATGRWRGRAYLFPTPLLGVPTGRRLTSQHSEGAARLFGF